MGITRQYTFSKNNQLTLLFAGFNQKVLNLFYRGFLIQPDDEQALVARLRLLIENDRLMLQAQLQAYAGCDDPEVREVVRRGFGRLVDYVEAVSGAEPARISEFFAKGMLCNVIAAMALEHADEHWAQVLMACLDEQ